MKNWKELGEVPDSDEEELDTQDSQVQHRKADLPPLGSSGGDVEEDGLAGGVNDGDTWGVPNSPQKTAHHGGLHIAQPPTKLIPKAFFPQVTLGNSLSPPDHSSPGQNLVSRAHGQYMTSPSKRRFTEECVDSWPDHAISQSRIDLPAQPHYGEDGPGQTEALHVLETVDDIGREGGSGTGSRESSIEHGSAREKEDRRRLERSLRPRKPIQQHPYLLENAQYTKFMKSHGVKPVRVPIEDGVARRRLEEDSEEQDFRIEESQEGSGQGLNQGLNGPQMVSPGGDIDDRDELALSPPSPKTSSLRLGQQASSQPSSADQTDDTSLLGEDEFPSLDELTSKAGEKFTRPPKRPSSATQSSHRKRLKSHASLIPSDSKAPRFINYGEWDIPPFHPGMQQTRQLQPGSRSPPQYSSYLGDGRSPASEDGGLGSYSSIAPSPSRIVDLTAASKPGTPSDDDSQPSASDSEASDIVQRNGRRIRGVLPASWLRLDQRNAKQVVRKETGHDHSSHRNSRRGVALTRQSNPKLTNILSFSFSDSDNDFDNEATTIRINSPTGSNGSPTVLVIDDEDGISVVEEDYIDEMMPSGERNHVSSPVVRTAKKRKGTQQTVFRGGPGNNQRQSKITKMLSKSRSNGQAAPGKGTSKGHNRTQRQFSVGQQRPTGASTPPPLSILDVIEPNPPRFIKIAARTARGKRNLGKSSPTRKQINLGTRNDNVDALSVLRDWRAGQVRPKVSYPSSKPSRLHIRPPLGELAQNVSSGHQLTQAKLNFGQAGQTGTDYRVGKLPGEKEGSGRQVNSLPTSAPRRLQKGGGGLARPAQLETTERERQEGTAFTARKRALDAVYRKSRKGLPNPHNDRLERYLDDNVSVPEQDRSEDSIADPNMPESWADQPSKSHQKFSRYRKRHKPKRLNPDALQFAHAGDPLPPRFGDIDKVTEEAALGGEKLVGLGPYGTHYTQHFDAFPLDHGVFFHQSTLVGSGRLARAVAAGYRDTLRHRRPHIAFDLDNLALEWGTWNDTVSSELGILLDWIMEHGRQPERGAGVAGSRRTVDAADYLLNYALDSLCLPNDLCLKSYAARIIESFGSFVSQLEAVPRSFVCDDAQSLVLRTRVQVVARLLIVMLSVRHVIRDSDAYLTESFQVEEGIRRMAKTYVMDLLDLGLEDLPTLYGDVQQLSYREHGIRADRLTANSWVIAMRVLALSQIPGASFWDITWSAICFPEDSNCDARKLEELWQAMFYLLPLTEFDEQGVLVSGVRHSVPMEGWILPQHLMGQVFRLYKANQRQPPSFNEYCRAIVARCHFLIQQWGWRKCSGIIGAIFDFFGSQNLSHLRNEEVFESPRFLEELAQPPSLGINPQDRCFHIFVKILALLIKRLRSLGLNNDIRNLVARTMPNHNRQYLKEDTVHEHELASLRNHHDLLCAIFWAAPPDLRPAVRLIEKLVVPGSSHKQACLINLRAWNQLARFVVSSEEGSASYKPFIAWQNGVFQQILDQYLSADSDIQQQVLALPKDAVQGISRHVVDAMVSKNRAASMDILHASMKASLDVLKHCPSLSTATYAINLFTIEQVFTRFNFSQPLFDWGILQIALDIIEYYMTRLEKALDEQYSSAADSEVDAPQIEEAILLLDHKLAESFFPMVRAILSLGTGVKTPDAKDVCLEKAVVLSAKIASRFIHSRIIGLSRCFMPGKYGVFETKPNEISSPQRKYFPLFVSTLLKSNIFNFTDTGVSLFTLWMSCITRPFKSLAYENYLAETLKHHNFPFLANAFVPVGTAPDYSVNRDFFACGMTYMRRALREASAVQERQLRQEFASILQGVMQGMKTDLKLLRSNPAQQKLYVSFVQEIIGLVKSHGVNICIVDQFFIEPSADYSPPLLDPQLHAAGIIAYGIRLGEGDKTAGPQLFHYLYQNFKVALANDKLGEECSVLEKVLEHPRILAFIVGRLLPAVIQATRQVHDTWPLLGLYSGAVGKFLTRSCLSREIDEDGIESVMDILHCSLSLFRSFLSEESDSLALSLIQIHITTQLTSLANAFQASLTSCSYRPPRPFDSELQRALRLFADFAEGVKSYLGVGGDFSEALVEELDARRLFSGLEGVYEGSQVQEVRLVPQVEDFAKTVAADVRASWVVTRDTVALRVGRRVSPVQPTQAGQGARYEPWTARGLLNTLRGEARRWKLGKEAKTRRGVPRIRGKGWEMYVSS